MTRLPKCLAVAALFAIVLFPSDWAVGHPAKPPPPLIEAPTDQETIPEEDQDFYVSQVSAIRPRVPGLSARILGGDERLEVTWTGDPPLVIVGAQGEPMIRLGSGGVEVNVRSPSLFLSTERYGRASMPVTADPRAAPRWRRVDSPGPFSWYEHRAHWLRSERPSIVADGTGAKTIFHWRVPALLGNQRVEIVGALDWVPDPEALRAARSDVSSPLLSAGILLVAMALGAGVGVLVRERLGADETRS